MQRKPVLAAVAFCACAHGASLLLVLNKGDHTLAIVDAATLEVKGRVSSGPDPHEVIASPDGRVAWISNYMQGNGAQNTISVVDLVARKALAPIDLGALSRPHGLAWADGQLYFTAEGAKVIGRYDPATGKINWVMGTGQNRTHMLIVSNDRKRIYTTNVASGTVCFIDQVEGGMGRGPGPPRLDWNVTVIPVGRGDEGFDISPDGKELWAANAQDGTVSIIDIAAKRVVATVPAPCRSANRLKFTLDGKHALISDLGGRDMLVMDTASRKVIKQIPLGGSAAGMLMDPNGTRAFVSVGPANSVAVVDLSTLEVTGRIASGPGPDGLAWAESQK